MNNDNIPNNHNNVIIINKDLEKISRDLIKYNKRYFYGSLATSTIFLVNNLASINILKNNHYGSTTLNTYISFLMLIMMKLYKKRIAKIMCVSHKALNHFKELSGKSDAIVIYNGVDTEFYNPNLPTPHKKGTPQLLFVSVLRKYKKTGVLIDAIPELLKKYPTLNIKIVEHPGYVNIDLSKAVMQQDLSKLINESCFTIATSSVAGIFVKKYIEIPLSGSVIVGDIPIGYEDLLENNIVEISQNTKNDDIFKKILDIINGKYDYMLAQKRINKFAETIKSKYSYEKGYDELLQILNISG